MKFAKIDRSSVTEQIIEYLRKTRSSNRSSSPGSNFLRRKILLCSWGSVAVPYAKPAGARLSRYHRTTEQKHLRYLHRQFQQSHGGISRRIHKHRDVEKIIEVRRIIRRGGRPGGGERDSRGVGKIRGIWQKWKKPPTTIKNSSCTTRIITGRFSAPAEATSSWRSIPLFSTTCTKKTRN